jgi:hypothetical protein
MTFIRTAIRLITFHVRPAVITPQNKQMAKLNNRSRLVASSA